MGQSDYRYRKALVDDYNLGNGWMVNWPPGTNIALGTVGRYERGSFTRKGWLHDKSRGVTWTKDAFIGTPGGPWSFQSEKTVKFEVGLKGEVDPSWSFIGQAKAGLKFSFAKGGGVVVYTDASHEEHISDQKALSESLLRAYSDGNRMDEYDVVITAVKVADSGFVLISNESGGEVTATTNAEIKRGASQKLGEVATDLNFTSQNGMSVAESYPDGFVIAFQGLRLIGRYWRWLPLKWRFGNVELDTLKAEEEKGEIFLELPPE